MISEKWQRQKIIIEPDIIVFGAIYPLFSIYFQHIWHEYLVVRNNKFKYNIYSIFRIFFGMKLILIVTLHECKAHVTRMFDVITPKVQTKTFASKF